MPDSRSPHARLWIRALGLAALALALVASPAAAEIYTVTLDNGTSFISRYQPQESSWDPETVLLLTDVGNWIALSRGEIESITSESETRGFGLRVNSATLVFGWAPNDAPTEEEAPAQADPFSSLNQFLNRSYDVQQFVEPGAAGGGGVPVYGVPYFSGGGSSQSFGGAAGAPVSSAPAPGPSGSGGEQ